MFTKLSAKSLKAIFKKFNQATFYFPQIIDWSQFESEQYQYWIHRMRFCNKRHSLLCTELWHLIFHSLNPSVTTGFTGFAVFCVTVVVITSQTWFMSFQPVFSGCLWPVHGMTPGTWLLSWPHQSDNIRLHTSFLHLHYLRLYTSLYLLGFRGRIGF